MKKLIAILLTLASCGGGSSSGTTKYLASNIIFSTAEAATSAHFAVDSTTQILASNVLLDTDVSLGIDADNVQEAMEQVAPSLEDVIVGTWGITEISSGDSSDYTSSNGTINFGSDGTFSLSGHSDSNVDGPFAFIIEKEGDCSDLTHQYQVVSNAFVSLKINSVSCPWNQIVPMPVYNGSAAQITLLGQFSQYVVLTKQ